MDDFKNRWPENISGKYYVSNQCMDCDLCRETAPANFARHHAGGYSYVRKQPETPEEEALVRECVAGCCVDTIHTDGDVFDWRAIPADTPFYLTPEGEALRKRNAEQISHSCCKARPSIWARLRRLLSGKG
ncbi:MAG: ferredoxin [Verrucomicrobia bacterium]|nr:ferredoxin [Verrucomicrobiota bacterium]